ncbi:MAG TPA: UvrD-helicase domain-containing protein [Nitrospira sp.]
MNNDLLIPDRVARESAETTFDRNVVVVAGAGTGKTTLLVNRLVYLLMKEPDPIPITQVVALTFTNKAATEMKVRLRERLAALAHPEAESMRRGDGGAVSCGDLRKRYGLSADAIAARAWAALNDIEKAQIGTLHSFAAHLLRLHPLESGVDPDFKEDDGSRFEEQFTAAWDCWLDQELSRVGQHHHLWRSVLSSTTLEAVRTLGRSLCSELIDLGNLQQQLASTAVTPAVSRWIQHMRDRAEQFMKTYDRPKRRKVEHMLAATASLMRLVAVKGLPGRQDLEAAEREWLDKDLGSAVGGWEKGDFTEAAALIQTAQQLLAVNHAFLNDLLTLLIPPVRNIREAFARQGRLSFDGLLARGRTLLSIIPLSVNGLSGTIELCWSMSFRTQTRCSTKSSLRSRSGRGVRRPTGRRWCSSLENSSSWETPNSRSMPFGAPISRPSIGSWRKSRLMGEWLRH